MNKGRDFYRQQSLEFKTKLAIATGKSQTRYIYATISPLTTRAARHNRSLANNPNKPYIKSK